MRITTDTITITLESQIERDIVKAACDAYRSTVDPDLKYILDQIVDDLNRAPGDYD